MMTVYRVCAKDCLYSLLVFAVKVGIMFDTSIRIITFVNPSV